jgi:hypothetical protein
VEASYDRNAGHQALLRNLLQRQGYEDLDSVRGEGVAVGMAHAILALLDDGGLVVAATSRSRIEDCRDQTRLQRWVLAAARASDIGDLFR